MGRLGSVWLRHLLNYCGGFAVGYLVWRVYCGVFALGQLLWQLCYGAVTVGGLLWGVYCGVVAVAGLLWGSCCGSFAMAPRHNTQKCTAQTHEPQSHQIYIR